MFGEMTRFTREDQGSHCRSVDDTYVGVIDALEKMGKETQRAPRLCNECVAVSNTRR